MRHFKQYLKIPLILFTLLFFYGCENEGPMEKAGAKMDETMEDASDAVENSGPMEEMGEEADEAMDAVKEQYEETRQDIQNSSK